MGTTASVVSLPEVVGLVVFLALSAFFSGSETALFSLRRSRVEELARGEAGRRGRAVAQLLSRPHDLLVTILFGNLVVNVLFFGLAALVAFRLGDRGERGLAAGVGIGGLVAVVVFGEVLPKSFAVVLAEPLALWAGPAVAGLAWALRPALRSFLRVSDVVSRLFVRGPAPPHITAEELKMLVVLSRQEQGLIGTRQESLLIRALELGKMSVREVMLPRADVPFFELGRPREELLTLIERTRRELIPVARGGADAVVGVVRSARVLLEPERPVEELIEPVALVPESWTVEELLREFRREPPAPLTREAKGRASAGGGPPRQAPAGQERPSLLEVAIVVDEYGGTSGLVRLSDLVQAVLGGEAAFAGEKAESREETAARLSSPTSGESQEATAPVSLLPSPALPAGLPGSGRPRSLLLDARTSIRALGNLVGMDLAGEVGADSAKAALAATAGQGLARPVTVGGLVTALLGRWPVVGDQVVCGWNTYSSPEGGRQHLRFTVTEMRGRRLTKVRVDVLAS